ncbi:MAG: cyclic nucleotide-binding domain-containing protein [Chloroflexi bacterium]|nr:cyclic nucleotide-binding domain-containing protein [Chloroflexota bacterium]
MSDGALRDVLSQVDLFKGIPADYLVEWASRGRRRGFTAGAPLMFQGEISDLVYVLLRGRVRVQRSQPQLGTSVDLAELGPGEVVGELGALDGAPRAATVIAIEDTEVLELDAAALDTVMRHFPEVAIALLRSLTPRLRAANDFAEQIVRRQAAITRNLPRAGERPIFRRRARPRGEQHNRAG